MYALICGITNLAYVLAVINGEIVRAMLLFFLSPIWTIVLSFVFLREKIRPNHYIAACLSIIGAFAMLSGVDLRLGSFIFSDLMALVAGIFFALTNVMARKYTNISVKEKSYAIWIGVILLSLLIVDKQTLTEQTVFFSLEKLGLLFLIGTSIFVTTVIVQYGLTKIEAVKASPIFLFEIIVAAISSYLLANEAIGLRDIVGGVFIVIGILISARDKA